MVWVDFKHIKAIVSFVDVIAYYNLQLRESATGHFVGKCVFPCHAGDRTNQNAFHIDTTRGAFHCFTHCGGGNIIDFVSKMEGVSFRKAAELIQERFISEDAEYKDRQITNEQIPKVEELPTINRPLSFKLKGLQTKHPFLMREKGLKIDTISHFGLGFCQKGIMAGRIVIPIHDMSGQIIAYIGRAVNSTQAAAEGKYKVPPGFRKNLELFNQHRVLRQKKAVDKYGVIVVESFFGVFKLWEFGFKNVVALMGRSLSFQQERILLDMSDRITLFLDGDQPGREATLKILRQLTISRFVRIIEYPEGPNRKPAHFRKNELREILSLKKPS